MRPPSRAAGLEELEGKGNRKASRRETAGTPPLRGRSASLVGDRLDGDLRRLRVEVLPALDQRLEVVVQFVAERDAGGDVQLGDRLVADVVEVLDQRPQRVAVRDD